MGIISVLRHIDIYAINNKIGYSSVLSKDNKRCFHLITGM